MVEVDECCRVVTVYEWLQGKTALWRIRRYFIKDFMASFYNNVSLICRQLWPKGLNE